MKVKLATVFHFKSCRKRAENLDSREAKVTAVQRWLEKHSSMHFQGSFTRGKWQRSVPKGAVNYQKFTRAKKEKDYWMGVGLF